MGCSIAVTQKDIENNPMFYLYNAIYSNDIKWKGMGKFKGTDLINYFSSRNLNIDKEKVNEFIKDSLKNGLIYRGVDYYCILPR